MISHAARKSHHVNFKSWFGIFELLLSEHKMSRVGEIKYLQDLYNKDFSAIEAIHHIRILTIKSGLVTVSWYDNYGRESIALSNNESLRYFYRQNPRFKKSMDFNDAK